MFGVGAAFDLLGGRTKNAPAWMRDRGLEWLYRLALEPRRLWRRHLFNDPRFLVLLARQVLRERRRARRGA
jgi:N-acetylglucosaminyldiphosphoundecaprenol N-acetyl-beta-D-mannosaminyltransferase